jgi:hypothetical protein
MKNHHKFLLDRYFKNNLDDKSKYIITDTTFIINSYTTENIRRSKEYKWKKSFLVTGKYGIPI